MQLRAFFDNMCPRNRHQNVIENKLHNPQRLWKTQWLLACVIATYQINCSSFTWNIPNTCLLRQCTSGACSFVKRQLSLASTVQSLDMRGECSVAGLPRSLVPFQTLGFYWDPTRKKSSGFRSGGLGGQGTGWCLGQSSDSENSCSKKLWLFLR